MKRRKTLLAILLVLAMTLVACGGKKEKENNATKTDGETEVLKIGFVTDEGGINDQSFNQGVWEGIEKAKADLGIEDKYQESKDANDYKPNFETLLDDDLDLIVGAGFKMGDAIIEEAQANPDVKFAIVDVDPQGVADNLLGIMFKAEEPSFLVGYIAGYTTQTNVVGFVGGQESTLIDGFDYGFKAGVAYAAKEQGKDIEVKTQYVGGFSDAQKGKAIANSMYQQNADVIFHAAGGAGDGVIEAAKEQNKWAIGVDRDQNDLAPDNVLTSAMKNANVAVYDLIKNLKDGKDFEGGKTIYLGLKDEGAVGIAPSSDKHVAADVLEKVKVVEEKIINDEIKVPNSAEGYSEFVSTMK